MICLALIALQVSLTWTDEAGATRQRTVTRQLAATQSSKAVLEAADPAVTATLLAKSWAAQAVQKDAASARQAAESLRLALGGCRRRHASPYAAAAAAAWEDAGARCVGNAPTVGARPAAGKQLSAFALLCGTHAASGGWLSSASW